MTLQHEDLYILRRNLIGRMQIQKEDADGFGIKVQQELGHIREALGQPGGSVGERLQTSEQSLEHFPDPDQFFEHMFTTEKILQDELDSVQQQMTQVEGDLAEVKSRGTSHTHAPVASTLIGQHLTQPKSCMDSTSMEEESSERIGGSLRWAGFSRDATSSKPSFGGLRGRGKDQRSQQNGTAMEIGVEPLSKEQEWCCDELYALLSRKTKDGTDMIVRSLETLPTSRGARAWYRIVRQAEGQIETTATYLTEKLHDPSRKLVEAKDVAQALENNNSSRSSGSSMPSRAMSQTSTQRLGTQEDVAKGYPVHVADN